MLLPFIPAADPASAPPGKSRPWLKWILYPILLVPLSVPVLIVASVAYSLLTTDRSYREGMEYSGELKLLENDFREHFHGLQDYPALSLEELKTQHVLSGIGSHILEKYRHEFVPFSPGTPDSAVVLTVHGYRGEPDRFTKRDLTADPSAPNAAPPDSSPSPSARPSP